MKESIRKNGRHVFKTETNLDKIAAFGWIVDNSSFAIIDGVTVDCTSANYAIQLYYRLSDSTKEKILKLSIEKIIKSAFSLLS